MSRPDTFTNTPQDAARYERHNAVDDYDTPSIDDRDEPDDWMSAVMDDEPEDDPAWWRPAAGRGSWEPTPRHSSTQLTLLGAVVASAVFMALFCGAVLVGRHVMCHLYAHRTDGPSYCVVTR